MDSQSGLSLLTGLLLCRLFVPPPRRDGGGLFTSSHSGLLLRAGDFAATSGLFALSVGLFLGEGGVDCSSTRDRRK